MAHHVITVKVGGGGGGMSGAVRRDVDYRTAAGDDRLFCYYTI